jgi:hypothetical protein
VRSGAGLCLSKKAGDCFFATTSPVPLPLSPRPVQDKHALMARSMVFRGIGPKSHRNRAGRLRESFPLFETQDSLNFFAARLSG